MIDIFKAMDLQIFLKTMNSCNLVETSHPTYEARHNDNIQDVQLLLKGRLISRMKRCYW